MTATAASAVALATVLERTVVFDTPLTRGDTTIEQVKIRKPMGGDFRGGISLLDVARMDVDATAKLLPRITTPALTAAEVYGLEASDLLSVCSEVAAFLPTKAQRAAFPET